MQAGGRIHGVRWWRLGLFGVFTLVTLGGGRVAADVFHLKAGGTLEGLLLETQEGQHRVRTVVGIVRLPVADVERIEPGETPFEEYDRRAAAAPDTPSAQVALADWCGQQNLRTERRAHLRKALELDPDCEPARRALGYVRVGDLWVEGAGVAARRGAEGGEPAETNADRLIRAALAHWDRMAQIYGDMLESGVREKADLARKKLRAIRDPLAIMPLCEVLTTRDVACRQALLEVLCMFPHDEATMGLGAMSLLDSDDELRRAAVGELVRRADPRVVAQFRKALQTEGDVLVKRAAYALGELRARDALGELIDLLTAERVKSVEVPVRAYFSTWPTEFLTPDPDWGLVSVRGYEGGGWGACGVWPGVPRPSGYGTSWGWSRGVRDRYWDRCGRWILATVIGSHWDVQPVTVLRTEVLEALRKITGQDYGFDRAAWQRWLALAHK